ncbi:MAG: 3-deoxy-manno-octulosonate cytidylyltransferase [Muribaculaceae bacterium]|nr:3-deoxy-manno-octulosonate cytidylyltransferase [Muribaculaceae bacterium]
MKFIAIIPARYASTRFPGKPLALLGGVPVIERVWRRAADILGAENVFVATDDERIATVVTGFGNVVLTSPDHRSGTDRCREAADILAETIDFDVVINIQGDEPFIAEESIKALMACFDDERVDIASLARPFDPAQGFEALFDPNLVKVVMGDNGNALYFSRSVIPYVRSVEWQKWLDECQYYTHVGVYAYHREVLGVISRLEQSPLEKAESLEQLRWLAAGYEIRMALTTAPTIGIDTPDDLAAAEAYLASLKQS